MDSVSEKLIQLTIDAKKACSFTLKEKLLYLLTEKPLSPAAIMEKLSVCKSNLTHLSDALVEEGLIDKRVLERDRRQIEYRITQNGSNVIRKQLSDIENKFKNILTSESDYQKAVSNIDEILLFLSFL